MNKQTDKLVAIVGMGCRFPGSANNVEQFWDILKSGKDTITDIPEDRWSVEEYYHPNKQVKGKATPGVEDLSISLINLMQSSLGLMPERQIKSIRNRGKCWRLSGRL